MLYDKAGTILAIFNVTPWSHSYSISHMTLLQNNVSEVQFQDWTLLMYVRQNIPDLAVTSYSAQPMTLYIVQRPFNKPSNQTAQISVHI